MIIEDKLTLRRIISEQTLPFGSGALTPKEIGKIKSEGKKIYKFLRENWADTINQYFIKEGKKLRISPPSNSFKKRNLDDINWVLTGPGADVLHFKEYRSGIAIEKLKNLKRKLESQEYVIFQHGDEEGVLDWSFINLFDTGYMFWVDKINEAYDKYPNFKDEVDRLENSKDKNSKIIDLFFNFNDTSKVNFSPAFLAFLSSLIYETNMLEQRLQRFMIPAEGVERSFVDWARRRFPEKEPKVFASRGGIVDQQMGVDVMIYDNRWIPIQVKSKAPGQFSKPPVGGCIAWPSGERWGMKCDYF